MFKTKAKTVASIMQAFTKTIDELRQAQLDHSAIAEAKQDEAAQALTEAKQADAEAIRASDMADRLEALVG